MTPDHTSNLLVIILMFFTLKRSPAEYSKLACQAAKLHSELMTYKPMIDDITGILVGSEFTDQLSIHGLSGRIPDVMKNTIIHTTLFKIPFPGLATPTAQQHV
jgi:hypothetical protein